jgi:hypothetical protein
MVDRFDVVRIARRLVVLKLFLISGCVIWAPPIYIGDEIHGQVVDEEHGTEIENAVVVANYMVVTGGPGHGGHAVWRSHEAVTDTSGNYTLPPWGPVLRPLSTALDRGPKIVVFKAGYESRHLYDDRKSNAMHRASQWNGQVIRLRSCAGCDSKARLRDLEMLMLIGGHDTKRLLKEMLREETMRDDWPPDAGPFFESVRDFVEGRR